MKSKNSLVNSIILSSVFAILAICVMTIFGEINPNFKNILTVNFKHHWIGKSILVIFKFCVSVVVLRALNLKLNTIYLIWVLIGSVSFGFGLLLLFFAIENFGLI